MNSNEVKIGQAVRWKRFRNKAIFYGIIFNILSEEIVTIIYSNGKRLPAVIAELEPALPGDHPT
jgi:hypothetical protein